jgi:hypothetical protein
LNNESHHLILWLLGTLISFLKILRVDPTIRGRFEETRARRQAFREN